jgi:hypothetical protein
MVVAHHGAVTGRNAERCVTHRSRRGTYNGPMRFGGQ